MYFGYIILKIIRYYCIWNTLQSDRFTINLCVYFLWEYWIPKDETVMWGLIGKSGQDFFEN